MAGSLCNFATQLKFLLRYDDCLDVRILTRGSLYLVYLFVEMWRAN